ncbi:class I SAM-dependent methyltransferase [Opitutales bacterium]|jgi:2-polyprenyl-3-methyl-5-hydroxy-6-metoxy-1,4-benzoquinol methylase|nr:class I SAM-dependent methyltransferase [Opitutales bacterium]
MPDSTKEPQNQSQYVSYKENGPMTAGPWTTHIGRSDPRHLAFLLARYKFVSKMLFGKKHALEVGCGDAFGTPLVLQEVDRVTGIDFEPLIIKDLKNRLQTGFLPNFSCHIHDMTEAPLSEKFDSSYSLDVIEHISPDLEHVFLENIVKSLSENAILLMGTPNITASKYASEASMEGHINLKSGETMRTLLNPYFENVFIFSMNDEVVHTGFLPMSHYIIGMGVGLKKLN